MSDWPIVTRKRIKRMTKGRKEMAVLTITLTNNELAILDWFINRSEEERDTINTSPGMPAWHLRQIEPLLHKIYEAAIKSSTGEK